jgi:LacI family transcriptional regulator
MSRGPDEMVEDPTAGDGGPGSSLDDGRLPFGDRAGRATLRTIAHLAGVHVSTVSRVLAPGGRPPARTASPVTAARIRAMADQLGYVPNPHATGLRSRRSNLVGVLVPRLTDIVLATIYEGIEEAAGERGLHTFVSNSRDDPGQRERKVEMLLDRRVDGLVLGDAPLDGVFADGLARRGVPFVLVSRRVPGHPSVTCDDYLGGRLVAEHLLGLGHEYPAVIAGAPYASTGVDRTAGFVDRYAEAGLPVSRRRVVPSTFDVAGGRAAAAALLDGVPRPTALFAVNDFAAIGALGALRDRGLVPGDHIAVVGFNDVPVAADLPVPLTTVRSPMHEMGRRAAHLLIERLAGREVPSERLKPALVVRSSCGTPR